MAKPDRFDQKVAIEFGALTTSLMKEHPELRSVAVVFDWGGELNAGAIPGMWSDREGMMSPGNCGAIVGSIQQLTKMLLIQTQMNIRMVTVIGETAAQKMTQLEQIEEQLHAGNTEAPPLQGAGGSGGDAGKSSETPED